MQTETFNLSDGLIDGIRTRFSQEAAGEREADIKARLIELGWTPPWEPIDTAPKDGRPFIGWINAVRMALGEDDDYREFDASDADFCRWIAYPDDPEADHFENDAGQIGDQQRITHWLNVKPPK